LQNNLRIKKSRITFAPSFEKAPYCAAQMSHFVKIFNSYVMNTLSYRTDSISTEKAVRTWYVVNAENQVVGRLSAKIASILRGKNKPSYTPHADTGDYIIVINADKVRFTGKKWEQKTYKDYSLHPGGLKVVGAEMMLDKHPVRILERAVKGMLPKNKLGRHMYKKLFVYATPEHPHAAQKPEAISLSNPLKR